MDQARRCAKCDEHSAGAGGILCPGCLAALAKQAHNYWRDHPPSNSGALDNDHHGHSERAP